MMPGLGPPLRLWASGFAYGVTFSTARNWWDGLTAPRGHHVAAEAMAHPAFLDFLRGKLGAAA